MIMGMLEGNSELEQSFPKESVGDQAPDIFAKLDEIVKKYIGRYRETDLCVYDDGQNCMIQKNIYEDRVRLTVAIEKLGDEVYPHIGITIYGKEGRFSSDERRYDFACLPPSKEVRAAIPEDSVFRFAEMRHIKYLGQILDIY